MIYTMPFSFTKYSYDNYAKSAFNNYTARGSNILDNFRLVGGSVVLNWYDRGTGNYDLTASGSPEVYSSGPESINNKNAVRCDINVNEFARNSSSGVWNFLNHNSSIDWTLICVFKCDTTPATGTEADIVEATDNGTSWMKLSVRNNTGGILLAIRHSGVNLVLDGVYNTQYLDEAVVVCVTYSWEQDEYTMHIISESVGYLKKTLASPSGTRTNATLTDFRVGHELNDPAVSIGDLQIWKELKSDNWIRTALKTLLDYYKA